MRPLRPRVLCNMAPSLDGKIAPAHKRAPFTMSRGSEDPKRMHALRARADAVIIGATNLEADDRDLMPSLLRVVVTRAGERVNPAARMFDPALGGEGIVAHAATMPADRREALGARATLVELGASEVDVGELLEWLGRERGCKVVLCEGGGVLNANLLAARAIDEMFLTIVPRVLGGSNAPTVVAGDGFAPDALPDARLTHVDQVGDELFLTYAFDWSEPARASRRHA
ncbi:MAG TPA: dihydrofolate reductase family protein [Polyangiaceae bacterium]